MTPSVSVASVFRPCQRICSQRVRLSPVPLTYERTQFTETSIMVAGGNTNSTSTLPWSLPPTTHGTPDNFNRTSLNLSARRCATMLRPTSRKPVQGQPEDDLLWIVFAGCDFPNSRYSDQDAGDRE